MLDRQQHAVRQPAVVDGLDEPTRPRARPISADGTATVVSRGFEIAGERDPVEADDPDVVGDPDAEVAERVHEPERELVVVADERLGQVGRDLARRASAGCPPRVDRGGEPAQRSADASTRGGSRATVSARIVFEARTPLST